MPANLAHPRTSFNTSLSLRGGRTLRMAPLACPSCSTIQRPIDAELDEHWPLRLVCRGCGCVLIEVTPPCA
jgi:hypothetical protein